MAAFTERVVCSLTLRSIIATHSYYDFRIGKIISHSANQVQLVP